MSLAQILDQLHSRLLVEAEKAALILLHPESKYRSALVAHLINSETQHVVYYALGPDDLDLSSFLYSLAHDVARQHPSFGRHLNLLSGAEIGDHVPAEKRFEHLLQAFIEDLHELSSTTLYLILDEYDCADSADDIQRFVERAAFQLPPGCKLILNGRTLPRLSWYALIAAGKAAILDDGGALLSDFHRAPNQQGNPVLQIRALGPGFVLLNDKPIDTWEGHLPRLLFFFAVDRPAITRSEICAAFWPDMEIEQAVNVFHVTKRRLHKALGIDILDHTDDLYQISPFIDVDYDVSHFVTSLSRSRRAEGEEKTRHLQDAVAIYSNPFLRGHNDPWIVERREAYAAGFVEAQSMLAAIRRHEGRNNHALAHILRALDADWIRKELHVELMELYVLLGRRSEAVAHFHRLSDEAARVERTLAPEIIEAYEKIIAG